MTSQKRWCWLQIAQNVASASEPVISRENAADIHKTGMSKTPVHTIVKQELKLQQKNRNKLNLFCNQVWTSGRNLKAFLHEETVEMSCRLQKTMYALLYACHRDDHGQ